MDRSKDKIGYEINFTKYFYKFNSDNQFSFSNFLMRFKPDVKKVIPKFIYYFLRSHITRERVLRMVSSTTYPNLKVDEYISSKIPIPSITEQKRIVSFLDKKNDQFNSLIEKIEKKINLLKEKKNSLLHLYFTKGIDPNVEIKKTNFKWIGNIPKHWKISKVAYLAKDLVSGPFGSSLTKDTYVKDGFKVNPTEKKFENHIEKYLNSIEYKSIHFEKYDRTLCLIKDEVIRFY
jgi:type I restriction enzyme S subunit